MRCVNDIIITEVLGALPWKDYVIHSANNYKISAMYQELFKALNKTRTLPSRTLTFY